MVLTWRMMGALLSRAASSEATTVEEEVQFCKKCSANDQFVKRFSCTYDGRDGELLLLGVLEELQSNRLAKVLSSF